MKRGFVIGIIGVESSGKTLLAQSLRDRLVAEGKDAALVAETLREFCEVQGRTPRLDEQAQIAGIQTRRIEAAAAAHAFVVADTTALMIAVYSDFVFGDRGLYAQAERDHRHCDLTLLTALDLPWQPDGLQRDGPQVREPVDALIRAALQRMGLPYVVVAGIGDARLESAWSAVRHALRPPREDGAPSAWHHICERCGDPNCERHLLPSPPALSR